MKTFSIRLLSVTSSETIEGVESFVAEDSTGSFGILAEHGRFMSILSFGLAKFRVSDKGWEFLGLPNGIIYFRDNVLSISVHRYIRGKEVSDIAKKLSGELLAQERELDETRLKIRRLEAKIVHRLAKLSLEP
jgi:F-type H+-transporting ATPase subunit epsilon